MNFIVFDLEATCWENQRHTQVQEIIEIGAIQLDDYGEMTGQFNRFVKPVLHPTLSIFCKQLTSIEQKDVDRADEFGEVVEDFLDWIGYHDNEEFLLCSWGYFDQKALRKDCRLHKVEEDWLEHHISIKHQYRDLKSSRKPVGLRRAVLNEGFEFEGIHHRAISDAYNLAKIFAKYKDEWIY